MADNLPRPATPGPWEAGPVTKGLDLRGTVTAMDSERHVAYVAVHARPVDGPAIAALPERIRRMDGIRRVAEDGLDYEPTACQQGYAAACRAVLRWLDGKVDE